MAKATFDKSRTLQLFARIGETGVPKVLTFVNEDGTDHAIASYDFELQVYSRPNSPTALFTLAIGSGLTVQNTNELLIEITAAQAARDVDTYFWKLYSDTEDHTWLNGPFYFHDGEFDGVVETDTITITENGTSVEITVSQGVSAATQAQVNTGSGTGYVIPSTLRAWSGNDSIVADAYGAVGDGVTDNTAILQSIITTYAGQKIVIGTGPDDVYLIDKAISVPSDSIIEINGTIKLSNGYTRSLTANTADGSNRVSVASADTYFKVGQRVVVSDDNQPVNGGGAWKTRKVGNTGVITAVTSTYIDLDNNLSGITGGAYQTAQNAKVGQANSIFIIDGVTNVSIFGSGILNGNLANQYNIAGSNYNRTIEDLRSSCGVSLNDCSEIKILGLTITGFVLHGVSSGATSTDYCDLVTIDGLTIDGCVDKAIAGLNMTNSFIRNCRNINGVDEGEIILYNGCSNVVIDNIVSYNNRRYGVALTGQNNVNITLSNLLMNGNQTYDIYIQNQLYGTNISNVICSGSAPQDACFVINSCKNVEVKNVKIYGKTASTTHFSITANTAYAATSDDIRIDGLTIKDSNSGSGSQSVSVGLTNRCVIQNFSIDGVYRPFNDGAGNDYVKFINGYVGTYASTLFVTDNSKFLFSNVKGIVTENSSASTIPSGSTSVTVNHLMTRTPLAQNIKVTPTNNLGNASHFWISDINSRTFKINVDTDPGASTATFRWDITTLFNDVTTEPTYTTNYTSDFSAGVDGWSSSNLVTSGNNDAISDGTTSLDNVLKTYADATNGAHDLSKAIAYVGSLNRITFKYYIPSAQTNVNGLRVYGNAFGTTVISLSLGAESAVVGTWTEVTTAYFTPTSTTVYIRLMKTSTTSYAGANSAADDILYLKDIVVQRI